MIEHFEVVKGEHDTFFGQVSKLFEERSLQCLLAMLDCCDVAGQSGLLEGGQQALCAVEEPLAQHLHDLADQALRGMEFWVGHIDDLVCYTGTR